MKKWKKEITHSIHFMFMLLFVRPLLLVHLSFYSWRGIDFPQTFFFQGCHCNRIAGNGVEKVIFSFFVHFINLMFNIIVLVSPVGNLFFHIFEKNICLIFALFIFRRVFLSRFGFNFSSSCPLLFSYLFHLRSFNSLTAF